MPTSIDYHGAILTAINKSLGAHAYSMRASGAQGASPAKQHTIGRLVAAQDATKYVPAHISTIAIKTNLPQYQLRTADTTRYCYVVHVPVFVLVT